MKLCFIGVVPLKAGIHPYSLLININKFSPKKEDFRNFCRINKYTRIVKEFGQFSLKSAKR